MSSDELHFPERQRTMQEHGNGITRSYQAVIKLFHGHLGRRFRPGRRAEGLPLQDLTRSWMLLESQLSEPPT